MWNSFIAEQLWEDRQKEWKKRDRRGDFAERTAQMHDKRTKAAALKKWIYKFRNYSP
ncbi:hypothetical protein [Paenibacillus arenilitoris]|uniref:Uncharacterized protein n=1 Tax=Paenibacillus arenilitoris TaxID=2772299 RepID=A0A927H6V1_9BACL|nr:hypothetical protein [Paenibacillus arenilitoris]MBD2869958.1 hypothetical protein [Paenibacillus arenilitoris]